jgi:hypothetical protein
MCAYTYTCLHSPSQHAHNSSDLHSAPGAGSRAVMVVGTLPYLLPKQSEVTVCEVSCRLGALRRCQNGIIAAESAT